ncbi:unnamed protein product, partial [Protopolystoma xenopodis]
MNKNNAGELLLEARCNNLCPLTYGQRKDLNQLVDQAFLSKYLRQQPQLMVRYLTRATTFGLTYVDRHVNSLISAMTPRPGQLAKEETSSLAGHDQRSGQSVDGLARKLAVYAL